MKNEHFQAHLDELSETVERCSAILPAVEQAANMLYDVLLAENKILACGNGGSACDALHLVEELVGKYLEPRPALPGICLNADPAILTCIANDWDYAAIFERQVQALGKPGDVLAVFSSTGNSENLLRAVRAAKSMGIYVLAFTGGNGGRLKGMADVEVIVPSHRTSRIQELHTWILHELLEFIEDQEDQDTLRS